jgi:hypothetical protein
MRRAWLRGVGLAALATGALVGAVLLLPVPVDLSLRAYAVALAGITIALVVSTAGLNPVFGSTPPRQPFSEEQDRERWGGLAELENAVEFAISSGFDLHHRLRPQLRQIAAQRLARAGVDLDRDPERAQALVGPDAWELLRPERPEPPRRSRGTSVAALDRIVADLERCG